MRTNGKRNMALFALILPLLSSCGARVKSFPYDESADSNVGHGWFASKEFKKLAAEGFVYSLPKTVMEISGKCTLYRQIFYKDSLGGDEIVRVLFTANLDNGVTVSPKGQVDPTMRFRIDPKALRNWRVKTGKANFVLSDSGIMTKMNSTFEDKTAEIIESTAKTAINVAKTMALAGADEHVKHGLIENVGTFDIVGKVDPDDIKNGGTVPIFQDLIGRAQELAHASLLKDELRDKVGSKETIIVANQLELSYQPSCLQQTHAADLRKEVADSNFISGATRLLTFENFGKNYVNGIVTRIPAFANVTITATPIIKEGEEYTVVLKEHTAKKIGIIMDQIQSKQDTVKEAESKLETDKQLCQQKKDAIVKSHNSQLSLNKANSEKCRKLECDYKSQMQNIQEQEKAIKQRNNNLVQQKVDIQKCATEQAILTKGHEDLSNDKTVIFKALVPISQLGRVGVIPVHSNTFVTQTKNIDINADTGRVATYDFDASSSGEKAAQMLEHISESVVKDVPDIIKSLSKEKTTK